MIVMIMTTTTTTITVTVTTTMTTTLTLLLLSFPVREAVALRFFSVRDVTAATIRCTDIYMNGVLRHTNVFSLCSGCGAGSVGPPVVLRRGYRDDTRRSTGPPALHFSHSSNSV